MVKGHIAGRQSLKVLSSWLESWPAASMRGGFFLGVQANRSPSRPRSMHPADGWVPIQSSRRVMLSSKELSFLGDRWELFGECLLGKCISERGAAVFFFHFALVRIFWDKGCSVNGPRTVDRLLVRTVSVGCWTSAMDEMERSSFCYLQRTFAGFWGGLNWSGGAEAATREIRGKSGAFGHVWTSMRKRVWRNARGRRIERLL